MSLLIFDDHDGIGGSGDYIVITRIDSQRYTLWRFETLDLAMEDVLDGVDGESVITKIVKAKEK